MAALRPGAKLAALPCAPAPAFGPVARRPPVAVAQKGRAAAAVGAAALARASLLPLRASKGPAAAEGEERLLLEAAAELRALQQLWSEGPEEESREALRAKEAAVRAQLRKSSYGDPAETFIVPQHSCGDPLVAAHSAATRALVELELARASLESQGKPSETVDIAVLHLRLLSAREAYETLQSVREPEPRLEALALDVAKCQGLREPGAMTGEDLGPGSEGAALLAALRARLLAVGYTKQRILEVTGAKSLVDFSDDSRAEQFDTLMLLMEDEQEPGHAEFLELMDFARLLLLRFLLPLQKVTELMGKECLALLLSLQVLTVVEGSSFKLLSKAEALKALEEPGDRELQCFSNVTLWPIEEDLLIATDRQDWPQPGFEPVMYLSDDSLALLAAAPREPLGSVLDLCCGSGVQGIVALRYYAQRASFVDLNPRALAFTRFNLALNGLSEKAAGLHQGSLYSALPSDAGPFDAVLANPPFLPNPMGIASQAIALFGNGGELGEQLLMQVIRGADAVLAPTGWLAAVTYAPNVEEMPLRVQSWLEGKEQEFQHCRVFSGARKPAEEFQPVASLVEQLRYQEALKGLGITSLSEALTFLRRGPGGLEAVGAEPREDLFLDEVFLRDLPKTVLSS